MSDQAAERLAELIVLSIRDEPAAWTAKEEENGDELTHATWPVTVALAGRRCNVYHHGSIDIWVPKASRLAVRAAARRLLAVRLLGELGAGQMRRPPNTIE